MRLLFFIEQLTDLSTYLKTLPYLIFLLYSILSPTCGKLLHTLGITIHTLWKKLFFIPSEQVVENSLLL